MLETWLTLKIWLEYIIPTIILIVVVLVFAGVCFAQSFTWNRKIRWLKSHNFTRYLVGVPSFGNGAFYGWMNKETGKRIDERELKHLKFKSMVKEMEW